MRSARAMDFQDSPDDAAVRSEAAAFAAEQLAGAAEALEAAGNARPREFYHRLASAGWFRPLVPAAYGGAADRVGCMTACLIREEFARVCSFAAAAFAVQGLGAYPLIAAGNEAQRERWLPVMASGETIGAFALTERGAGSDVAGVETRAAREGDDYVLDGAKVFISNGGVADLYTVFARTGDARSARGLSAFLVEADRPGFSVTRQMNVMAFDVLAELGFETCRIPAANRLGEEGEGFALAMATLALYRTTVGAHAVGLARAGFEAARAWARTREQFGRPIGAFQGIGFQLADMASDIEAARLMVYRAARAFDCGAPDAARRSSMAKLFATEAAGRVIDAAVQIHGGWGVATDLPIERLYREIRPLRVYEGTSEIQRLVIAKAELAREPGDDL